MQTCLVSPSQKLLQTMPVERAEDSGTLMITDTMYLPPATSPSLSLSFMYLFLYLFLQQGNCLVLIRLNSNEGYNECIADTSKDFPSKSLNTQSLDSVPADRVLLSLIIV